MKTFQTNTRYLNNLQNTSPCKATYSFSRGSRFEPVRSFTPNKFYETPTTRSKRTTSIGFGKKLTLENKNTGDPGLYQIKSSFGLKNKSHQSMFGQSHTNIYDREIFSKKSPGPGSYNPEAGTNKNVKFYIGKKLKTNPNLMTPSPQHYNIKEQCLSKLSKHKDSRCFRISTQGNQRPNIGTKTPGPGQYYVQRSVTIEEIMKKSKQRASFSRTQRLLPIRAQTSLGPGSYQKFSVFGQCN